MKVIPSLAVRHGSPVVAKDGEYEFYSQDDGGPESVREVLEHLTGSDTLYLLDIDGIERNRLQNEVIRKLSALKNIWADVGARDVEDVTDAYIAGAHRTVISTKTMSSTELIEGAVKLSDRMILDISFKDGIISAAEDIEGTGINRLVEEALESGIGTFVLSDLSKRAFDWKTVEHLPREEYELYAAGSFDGIDERHIPDNVDGVIPGLEESIEWLQKS